MKRAHFIVLLVSFHSAVLQAENRINVQLLEEVEVENRSVTLGQVTRITGPETQARDSLQSLDILQNDSDEASLLVSRDLVLLRLMLHGYSQEAIHITGASECHVSLVPCREWTDNRLVDVLRDIIALKLNLPASDLQIELTSPVIPTLQEALKSACNVRFEPILPARVSTGRVSLTLKVWEGDRFVGTRIAQLQLRRRLQVAVAAASIERLQELKPGDLQIEDRFLSESADSLHSGDWVGRRPVRNLSPGDLVGAGTLLAPAPRPAKQLIRPRDIVQVVARSGAVRVTLQSAQALQGGNPGDLIRVRNESTDSILGGVIAADGRVEIRLK